MSVADGTSVMVATSDAVSDGSVAVRDPTPDLDALGRRVCVGVGSERVRVEGRDGVAGVEAVSVRAGVIVGDGVASRVLLGDAEPDGVPMVADADGDVEWLVVPGRLRDEVTGDPVRVRERERDRLRDAVSGSDGVGCDSETDTVKGAVRDSVGVDDGDADGERDGDDDNDRERDAVIGAEPDDESVRDRDAVGRSVVDAVIVTVGGNDGDADADSDRLWDTVMGAVIDGVIVRDCVPVGGTVAVGTHVTDTVVTGVAESVNDFVVE